MVHYIFPSHIRDAYILANHSRKTNELIRTVSVKMSFTFTIRFWDGIRCYLPTQACHSYLVFLLVLDFCPCDIPIFIFRVNSPALISFLITIYALITIFTSDLKLTVIEPNYALKWWPCPKRDLSSMVPPYQVDGRRQILSFMPAGLSQSRPLVLTYSGQTEGWDLTEKVYSPLNMSEIC